jgi:hypothetical protein
MSLRPSSRTTTSPKKPRSQRNLRSLKTVVNRPAQEVNKIPTMEAAEHQVSRLLHLRAQITTTVLLLLTRDSRHPTHLHSRPTTDNLVHTLRRLRMELLLDSSLLTAHLLDNHLLMVHLLDNQLTMLLSRAISIPSNRVISNLTEFTRATTIPSNRVTNNNLTELELPKANTAVAHRYLRLPLDNRQLFARQVRNKLVLRRLIREYRANYI